MSKYPFILAIDTSCDETSASVTLGQTLLSNVVASQTQLHKQYGGVFPTVAKLAHQENIRPVIAAALRRAQLKPNQLAAIAVTQGPGLAPALEIGLEHAKKLAEEWQLPLIPVNHIEGHVLSVFARPKTRTSEFVLPQLPALSVIVSGKHTDFILVKEIGTYQRLGFTVDDAAGEALDKFGRMVEIGYPAGATIEEFAKKGDPKKYLFPLPMTTSNNFNMSFSGLKTAARNMIEKMTQDHSLSAQEVYDLCASFQFAVFRAITYKLSKVLQNYPVKEVWLGGGVAANMNLRSALRETIAPHRAKLRVPYTKRLCMDNAGMIGVAAGFAFQAKKWTSDPQALQRLPRWEVGQEMSKTQ